MALSGRARAALEVLRSEAKGNPQVASALSSVERALDAPGTPGEQSADRARGEGRNAGPPPSGASSSSPKGEQAQDENTSSATGKNSFLDEMKRRRATARKGSK